jgi:hypothetical protein
MIEQPFLPPAHAAARTHRRPRFFVIWAGVSVLFIVSHFSFYFLAPHYEGGDLAANALQIRQAKSFDELYGNYSRFGFHHPGPAFFYAYALGEAVLFDTLKLVPSPYNAHAIIGVLIQALFFTWALIIAARRVQRPLLLPLLLAFAAVHFSLVNFNIPGSAFESIWPPYVLLCPFLCFLVAAASVASGKPQDLVPCVLAGCVLVHGHVAQPLFVVPLFLIAYTALCFAHRRSRKLPVRVAPLTHVAALCILALFLLPLLLDARKGGESNLQLIWQHFSQSAQDHKSLAQSFIYLGAFFHYVANPEKYCDTLNLSNLTFLVDRWPFLWMWIVVGIGIVLTPKPAQSDERRFFRWLCVILVIGLLLSLTWGQMQDHEMFGFNAYFYFGLLFVPFILLAIVIASRSKPASTGYLSPLLYLIALALGFATARSWSWHTNLPTAPSGTEAMVAAVRQAAVADRQGPRTKFLSFEHDAWEWAAGVALALERFGYESAVSPEWSPIFGAKHAADLSSSLRHGEVALWRVKSPAGGGEWVSNSIPPINPSKDEITFSGPDANARAFAVEGWEVSTGPFSWSTKKSALLYFMALPASSDVEIDFHVFPFSFSTARIQRMVITLNNGASRSFEVTQDGVYSLRVPAQIWNNRAGATLAFEFPDAISPKQVGESGDERLLGCGFIRIGFRRSEGSTSSTETPSGVRAFQ